MSLQKIKVSREEVLKIVQENKQKHDDVLKTAIEGYWLDAETHLKKNEKDQADQINKNHKDQLKKLRKSRKEALKQLKQRTKEDLVKVKERDRSKGFHYWGGRYPEDHGDDYLGTIRRLELSVDGEIELESNEFDSYIRNKWSWRDQFISTNTCYVNSYSSGVGISGSWASSSVSASYASTASYALSPTWFGTGSVVTLSNF